MKLVTSAKAGEKASEDQRPRPIRRDSTSDWLKNITNHETVPIDNGRPTLHSEEEGMTRRRNVGSENSQEI